LCPLCATTVGRPPGRSAAKRQQDQRRREQMRAAGPRESFTIAEIGERDHWICGLCQDAERLVDASRDAPRALSPSIDHIVAISRGGADTRVNVRITHLWCNTERNSGEPPLCRAVVKARAGLPPAPVPRQGPPARHRRHRQGECPLRSRNAPSLDLHDDRASGYCACLSLPRCRLCAALARASSGQRRHHLGPATVHCRNPTGRRRAATVCADEMVNAGICPKESPCAAHKRRNSGAAKTFRYSASGPSPAPPMRQPRHGDRPCDKAP
jgi:hypothetical protein